MISECKNLKNYKMNPLTTVQYWLNEKKVILQCLEEKVCKIKSSKSFSSKGNNNSTQNEAIKILLKELRDKHVIALSFKVICKLFYTLTWTYWTMIVLWWFLTYLWPMFPFYTHWKHQKTFNFLVFWGGIEWEHWPEMG